MMRLDTGECKIGCHLENEDCHRYGGAEAALGRRAGILGDYTGNKISCLLYIFCTV